MIPKTKSGVKNKIDVDILSMSATMITMHGTITFDNVIQLAEFLYAFVGSTATFKVDVKVDGRAVLEFLGGF